MIDEWQHLIDTHMVPDPRRFTKDFICESIALNMHLSPDRGPMIISGALWLVSDNTAVFDALKEPGTALLLEFLSEGDHGRRMKTSVLAS